MAPTVRFCPTTLPAGPRHWLLSVAGPFVNPITVASGNGGVATITSNVTTATYNGNITLNNHALQVLTGASPIALGGSVSGTGSVILNAGHKVFDLNTGTPFVLAGPDRADDEDFCRAVAP